MIADRAYDSDPLRERLKKRGIDLIVPYRENNKKRKHQDGRKLRRYKRRWIIERTNAWLGQFRRLLVRHESSSPPTEPSSISLASGSHSDGVYETRSKILSEHLL
ncbi:transposase [Granulicella aggregans]|uniref:Transposase n=1 Tax=Granulicella aggregans TaxID=474949 RepID=A0A7W7ZJK0_9BACT|nr:transposase [Granulicella aggregans]